MAVLMVYEGVAAANKITSVQVEVVAQLCHCCVI